MSNSDFNSDSPITNIDDDSLGRDDFARNLGDRIISYKSPRNETLVIGIAGEWGSGKSSLINMVLDHINKEYINSKSLEDVEKPILMNFNPWRFSDQDQLISQFFNEMSILLGKTDYENIINISKKIKLYSTFFEPVSLFVPMLGSLNKSITKSMGAVEEIANSKKHDLDKIREELDKSLKSQKHKIIIALDDIDRLNVKEIHLIFQLIKILANFPNIIYLIGFDREIVSKALSDDNKNLYGSDYLEKIIQVIFEIPFITENEVEELVIQNLEKEFDEFKNKEDKYYFKKLYNSLLKFKFRNIRNVNRYINTLKLTYDPVKDDVFYVDFYVLNALQVFLPEIYSFIRKNKELLLVDYDFSLDYVINANHIIDKENIRKELDNKLDDLNLPNIPNENIKSFLTDLFPNLQRIYTNRDNRNYIPNWILEKRICIDSYFDTYFKFTVPSWEISKKQFDSIVYSEMEEMVTKIEELSPNLQEKFISNLKTAVCDNQYNFEENNRKIIIETLIYIGDYLPNYEFYAIYDIIKCLLISIDCETSYLILKCAIEKSISLESTCSLVYNLYKESKEDKSKDYVYAPIELKKLHIDKLKAILKEKIKNTIDNTNLNELKNPWRILLIWKEIGADNELREYMQNISSNNLLIIMKILGDNNSMFESSEDSTMKAVNNLNEVIDLKTLYNKIKIIISSNKITEEELKIVRLFERTIQKKLRPKSFVESLKQTDGI